MVQGRSRKCQSERTEPSKGTHREIAQIVEYKNCTIPFRFIFLLDFSIRKAHGKHWVDHDI